MSNEQKLNIEKSLKRSINQAPALDFEKLAAMPVVKMTEHDYITRQPETTAKKHHRMPKYFKPVSAAFASCLVLLVFVSAWCLEFKTPDSIIALDANQSVEIVANKHKQILSVKAYDQGVQEILNEENLNQGNLEDSVSVIITTMIKNGYLDESKNVVMVSVENQNPTKANDMAVSLNQVIVDSASAENLTATVVRQSVTPDQEALSEAEQYNVSTGKLNVMKELVVADSSLTMESLAAMSLTDLLQVSKDKSVDLTNVIQVDDAQKDTKGVSTPVEGNTTTPTVTPVETPTSETKPTTETTNDVKKETVTIEPVVPVITETPVIAPVEPVTPVEPTEKQPENVESEKTTLELPKTEVPNETVITITTPEDSTTIQ
ncbi:MAG: hypothetical protein HY818_16015 [Acetobacterium woodii]|nr:hypothetical protein [Acetobacterium woodii]